MTQSYLDFSEREQSNCSVSSHESFVSLVSNIASISEARQRRILGVIGAGRMPAIAHRFIVRVEVRNNLASSFDVYVRASMLIYQF